MSSHRDDPTFVQQHNGVGECNGAGTVSDDDGGAAFHHGRHRLANLVLLRRIDGARGIVEHEHAWIGEDRTSKRDALTLATTQRESALSEQSYVTLWKFEDEVVSAGQRRRRLDVGPRSVWTGKRNVGRDGVVEEKGVFEDNRDGLAKVSQGEFANVKAVELAKGSRLAIA